MRHYIRSFVHASELRSLGSLHINSTFLPISKVLHPLYNIVNAFCNAYLNKLLYIADPGGRIKRGNYLRVIRALYSMPRSPLLWFKHLIAIIERLRFKPVLEYAYLYINRQIVVFFYVNDIIIIVHPKYYSDFLDFKAKLIAAYKMRDIGELKWFLGI
jgi:hypothetical protein